MLMTLPVDPPEEVTFKVTVAVFVSDPLVPVIVSVELATGVLELVVIVNVELEPTVTDAGLNEAVAPEGRPLAARLIEPVKPFTAPVLTV